MPIVELHVLEGYEPEDKRRLGEALTDAVRFVVPGAARAVTVMIHDMPAEDYYRGRTERSGAPARPDPADLVQRLSCRNGGARPALPQRRCWARGSSCTSPARPR